MVIGFFEANTLMFKSDFLFEVPAYSLDDDDVVQRRCQSGADSPHILERSPQILPV